ncbi:MAG: hypothetical protein ACO1ON_13045 [Nocardioides sp.]
MIPTPRNYRDLAERDAQRDEDAKASKPLNDETRRLVAAWRRRRDWQAMFRPAREDHP